jgi:hypothetical protein
MKVRLSRIVHMKANLLNGIGYLGTSQSGILESTGEASIEGGIRNGSTNRTR